MRIMAAFRGDRFSNEMDASYNTPEMNRLFDDKGVDLPPDYSEDDPNPPPAYTEEDTNPVEEAAEAGPEGLEEAEAVTSGAISGMSEAALPLLAAHQFQTGIGDLIINSHFNTEQTNNLNQLYQNQQTGGALAAQNAQRAYEWNAQQNENAKTTAETGNQFGLVGTLIGSLIGDSDRTALPQDLRDTAYSQYGRIDPTSDGVATTLDASSIPQNEIQNGVQTSESSSSIDYNPT